MIEAYSKRRRCGVQGVPRMNVLRHDWDGFIGQVMVTEGGGGVCTALECAYHLDTFTKRCHNRHPIEQNLLPYPGMLRPQVLSAKTQPREWY